MITDIPFHIFLHFNTLQTKIKQTVSKSTKKSDKEDEKTNAAKQKRKKVKSGKKKKSDSSKQNQKMKAKNIQTSDDQFLDKIVKEREAEEKLQMKQKAIEDAARIKIERKQVTKILENALRVENSRKMVEFSTQRAHKFKKDVEKKIWIDINQQVGKTLQSQIKSIRKMNFNDIYEKSLEDYVGDIVHSRVKYFKSLGIFDKTKPFVMMIRQRNLTDDKLPQITGYANVEDVMDSGMVPSDFDTFNPFEGTKRDGTGKIICYAVFYSYYTDFNLSTAFYDFGGDIGYDWCHFSRTKNY